MEDFFMSFRNVDRRILEALTLWNVWSGLCVGEVLAIRLVDRKAIAAFVREERDGRFLYTCKATNKQHQPIFSRANTSNFLWLMLPVFILLLLFWRTFHAISLINGSGYFLRIVCLIHIGERTFLIIIILPIILYFPCIPDIGEKRFDGSLISYAPMRGL